MDAVFKRSYRGVVTVNVHFLSAYLYKGVQSTCWKFKAEGLQLNVDCNLENGVTHVSNLLVCAVVKRDYRRVVTVNADLVSAYLYKGVRFTCWKCKAQDLQLNVDHDLENGVTLVWNLLVRGVVKRNYREVVTVNVH